MTEKSIRSTSLRRPRTIGGKRKTVQSNIKMVRGTTITEEQAVIREQWINERDMRNMDNHSPVDYILYRVTCQLSGEIENCSYDLSLRVFYSKNDQKVNLCQNLSLPIQTQQSYEFLIRVKRRLCLESKDINVKVRIYENKNKVGSVENDVKLNVIDSKPMSFHEHKYILNSQINERSTKLIVALDCSKDQKLNIDIEADRGKEIQKGLIDQYGVGCQNHQKIIRFLDKKNVIKQRKFSGIFDDLDEDLTDRNQFLLDPELTIGLHLWEEQMQPFWQPKFIADYNFKNLREVYDQKRGFMNVILNLNSLKQIVKQIKTQKRFIISDKQTIIEQDTDNSSYFYRIKVTIIDEKSQPQECIRVKNSEPLKLDYQEESKYNSSKKLQSVFMSRIIQKGSLSMYKDSEDFDIELTQLRGDSIEQLGQNYAINFQVQKYQLQNVPDENEEYFGYLLQELNSVQSSSELFQTVVTFKEPLEEYRVGKYVKTPEIAKVLEKEKLAETEQFEFSFKTYLNSIKLQAQAVASNLTGLKPELEYEGAKVKCKLVDNMYKLFKKIKKKRQNDQESEAKQLERIIIAYHQSILTGLLIVLNKDDLQECSNGVQNLKRAFSVLHDIIYLFQGEPSQLMQMHDSDLQSYPQFRQLLDKTISQFFEQAQSVKKRQRQLLKMILAEFKYLLKILQKISENKVRELVQEGQKSYEPGEKAIKTLRIMPNLLSFIQKQAWDSEQDFSKYLADNQIHETIYDIVEGIRNLEDNEDYLALPCYFLLKLKDIYAVYSKFPHAAENLNKVLVQQIYMKEEQELKVPPKKKIDHYLDKNKIKRQEDYTQYRGMPQLILTSKVKLTPKNFQFLKITQIKALLAEVKDFDLFKKTFFNFASYYQEYLQRRQFHYKLFEDEKELRSLTDITKTEALLPMLVRYFVLDSLFFPQDYFRSSEEPQRESAVEYHGNLIGNLEFFVEEMDLQASNLINLLADFPNFFFQNNTSEDQIQEFKIRSKVKARKQMKLLGLLNDLKTVSQEPINFTAGTFYTRVYHIFQFFFGVLEASVVAFSDSTKIPMYRNTVQEHDQWILIKHLMKNSETPKDCNKFAKFLSNIYQILKESLILSRKNPQEEKYRKGRLQLGLTDVFHFFQQGLSLATGLCANLIRKKRLEPSKQQWTASAVHLFLVKLLQFLRKHLYAETKLACFDNQTQSFIMNDSPYYQQISLLEQQLRSNITAMIDEFCFTDFYLTSQQKKELLDRCSTVDESKQIETMIFQIKQQDDIANSKFFYSDQTDQENDIRILVNTLRRSYFLYRDIHCAKKGVFCSLQSVIIAEIQDHEKEKQISKLDNIARLGIIKQDRIVFFAESLLSFFKEDDCQEFRFQCQHLVEEITNLKQSYESMTVDSESNNFNFLLQINDNYQVVKQYELAKLQQDLLQNNTLRNLIAEKSGNDQNEQESYRKNEEFKLDHSNFENVRNIRKKIEDLRKRNLNRQAHDYSINIEQNKWFTNRHLWSSEPNSLKHLNYHLKDNKQNLLEMKKLYQDEKSKIVSSQSYWLVDNSSKGQADFIAKDMNPLEMQIFTNSTEADIQKDNPQNNVQTLKTRVQPLTYKQVEQMKNGNSDYSLENLQELMDFVQLQFTEENAILQEWKLKEQTSQNKVNKLKKMNSNPFGQDNSFVDFMDLEQAPVQERRKAEKRVTNRHSNQVVNQDHVALLCLNWLKRSCVLFYSEQDGVITGVYQVRVSFPTLSKAQYVQRTWQVNKTVCEQE